MKILKKFSKPTAVILKIKKLKKVKNFLVCIPWV